MSADRAGTQVSPESLPKVRNLGWRVTMAGMGINLALGVLYTWSVISKEIVAKWQWSETSASWPYAIAILAFAFMTVPAGRLQDRIGPRVVASLGGILVGLGLLFASRVSSLPGYIIGFGLLAGAGIGLGYASATPPALKWFAAKRTGLIAGIVVGGFGLASVYAAPLSTYLLVSFGIPDTMLIFGVGFLIMVILLAQLLKNPPLGYCPPGQAPTATTASGAAACPTVDYSPGQVLKTGQFWLLWLMYAFAAGAGLMIVSKLAKIVKVQGGLETGFYFVAILAIGNAGGRVIAGMLSDRLGRTRTMLLVFVFQAVLMLLLARAMPGTALGSLPAFILLSALLGFNYGANLSLFPSVAKDYFGLKNFGVNYGLLFTAWGVGGFVMPIMLGWIYDTYQSFVPAYYLAAVLLALAALLSFAVKPPAKEAAEA